MTNPMIFRTNPEILRKNTAIFRTKVITNPGQI